MCWLLAPPPSARAQETLLVQASDPDALWVAEVESAVLVELRARGRDVVLPAPRPSAEAPPLEPALTAFHDLRPEDALALLDAWAEVEQTSAVLAPEVRARGYVWRARVLMALGRPGVDDALDAALRAHPDLTLDEATHPPPLRSALASRREALRWVTVTLAVEPAAAELRVDGALVSPGPIRLVSGPHVVSASAPRAIPVVRTLIAREDTARLELRLSPEAGALGGPVPEVTRDAVREAARRPLVLEARHGERGIRLRLRDAARVRTSGPEQDASRLAVMLFAASPFAPAPSPAAPTVPETEPAVPEPAVPEPAVSEPWWAVAVGAGVLVLGALVVGLVVGLQPADGFDAIGMRTP